MQTGVLGGEPNGKERSGKGKVLTLDTKEGEKDFSRQRDQAGEDMQQLEMEMC